MSATTGQPMKALRRGRTPCVVDICDLPRASKLGYCGPHRMRLKSHLGLRPDEPISHGYYRPLTAKSESPERTIKGKYQDNRGYFMERITDEDPFWVMVIPATARRGDKLGRSGYVLQHRLVMARHYGRPLRPNETVHHINGIRDDNRIENLQLRQGKHGMGQAVACHDCGSQNVGPVPLAEVST